MNFMASKRILRTVAALITRAEQLGLDKDNALIDVELRFTHVTGGDDDGNGNVAPLEESFRTVSAEFVPMADGSLEVESADYHEVKMVDGKETYREDTELGGVI